MKTLFDLPPKERAPRQVLMHVTDAGETGFEERGAHSVCLKCAKCGHETGWVTVQSVTEGKRGKPCPICNRKESNGNRET